VGFAIFIIYLEEINYYNDTVGPGTRSHAATWIDDQNNYWLFGGVGYSTTCKSGLCISFSLSFIT
jgi:hypothetical protein